MAFHVRVLGGAPGASICLRIFWNRAAFFCRFRVLGERSNGRSHAWEQTGWLKSLGLNHKEPSPLLFVCKGNQAMRVGSDLLHTPPQKSNT